MLSFVLPNAFFAIEKMRRTPFRPYFSMLSAIWMASMGASRFSSWLTRIAMSAALMRVRGSRRKRETSLDELTETDEGRTRLHLVENRLNPEQEYLSKEGGVLLEKGLKKLRPLYVEVPHLRGVRELSAKETAESLELPVATVKASLHRARTKLARPVQSIVATKRHRGTARN
jgi:RNA polymerase sigma-70 factor (ECF subfamily)